MAAAEAAGVWAIQAGCVPGERAEPRLHRALGFREIGVRERVGKMTFGTHGGAWRDVVMIERRSATVGAD